MWHEDTVAHKGLADHDTLLGGCCGFDDSFAGSPFDSASILGCFGGGAV
jgi:hypothetical protein